MFVLLTSDFFGIALNRISGRVMVAGLQQLEWMDLASDVEGDAAAA